MNKIEIDLNKIENQYELSFKILSWTKKIKIGQFSQADIEEIFEKLSNWFFDKELITMLKNAPDKNNNELKAEFLVLPLENKYPDSVSEEINYSFVESFVGAITAEFVKTLSFLRDEINQGNI